MFSIFFFFCHNFVNKYGPPHLEIPLFGDIQLRPAPYFEAATSEIIKKYNSEIEYYKTRPMLGNFISFISTFLFFGGCCFAILAMGLFYYLPEEEEKFSLQPFWRRFGMGISCILFYIYLHRFELYASDYGRGDYYYGHPYYYWTWLIPISIFIAGCVYVFFACLAFLTAFISQTIAK
ncbi:hypothetical protein ACFL35_12640 [Candidatus Riflebacteria bacterium]